MKILVDGRWLREDGIGRFSKEVIKGLDDVKLLKSHVPIFHPLEQLQLLSELKRFNPDVYFTPGVNPPLFWDGPFVFTIHDLIPIKFHLEVSLSKRIYFRTILKAAVKKAEKVLTVSEFTKNEILEWTDVNSEKIQVIYNGVNKCFNQEGEIYNPGYPYLLYIGNKRPHKNVESALRAYALSDIRNNVKFLLSGKANSKLEEIISQYKLQDDVIFEGFIPEEKLPAYYRGAEALIFPSFYEGFGLPVLESMACGTPVIASNVSSIPEIAGSAVHLINPYNLESIVEGIDKVFFDQQYKETLISKGLEKAKSYNWGKSVQEISEVFKTI